MPKPPGSQRAQLLGVGSVWEVEAGRHPYWGPNLLQQ